MLKRLLEQRRSSEIGDPAQFNDPVAEQTSWEPLVGGGANFQTQRVERKGPGEMQIVATLGLKFFLGIFILTGLGLTIGFSYKFIAAGEVRNFKEVIPLLVGVLFASLGIGSYWSMTRKLVLDRARGTLTRGGNPVTPKDTVGIKGAPPTLASAHALQIVSEYCSGNKSSYYSYELNLVLADASRINLMDHGSLEQIRADGKQLSEFLGVPLWDAVK